MSNNKQKYRDLFKGLEEDPAYLTECAIVEFTENMAKRMEDLGISRSELARRLNTSPAYITKILRGEANFTLKSMVNISHALQARLKTHMQPQGAYSQWLDLFQERGDVAEYWKTPENFKQEYADYHRVDISAENEDTPDDQVSFAA